MKAKRVYDIEDMYTSIEEAIDHVNNAMDELDGIEEYQDEINELISIRNRLEQLQEDISEEYTKFKDAEDKSIADEYDRMRL